MAMAGVCGGLAGFLACGVDAGGLHQPVHPPPRAGVRGLDHMVQTIQPQRGIFLVQTHQFPQLHLIALCTPALPTCTPGIVSASGDFQQTA